MYEFSYHRPQSLNDVTAGLSQSDDPKLLAGGQTLLPTLKLRLAQPSDLIDLNTVSELKGICRDDKNNSIVIGAMTTHAEVARSNDPAADYPAALLALNATVQTNQRTIAADDFFQGMFETALADDEIITAVHFPIPERAKYMKFPNPASRYALVGVMIAKTADGAIRIAVTGAGENGVFRQTEMEQALSQNFTPEALDGISVAPDNLNEDIHASKEYRAHLITVMAKRAVAAG